MKTKKEQKTVEKFVSYFPAQGEDVVTVDDVSMAIITLRRKQGDGACQEMYTIGNSMNALVGCGMKLKRMFAKLVSIELEQNPGNISAEDARLALGDGLDGFRSGYAALYGEDMLWRPAWKFNYEVAIKPEEGGVR